MSDDRPDRRIARTRRALKEALAALVLERGYEGVTVQDIIDRADVGRSTFYAHYTDKDELLLAVFADLDAPPPDLARIGRDAPPFGWTLELFRHIGAGRRLYGAVFGSRSGGWARREAERWLEGLVRAELARLGVVARRHGEQRVEVTVRVVVGAIVALMTWWSDEAPDGVEPDAVDSLFRSLVLPGVVATLGVREPGAARR